MKEKTTNYQPLPYRHSVNFEFLFAKLSEKTDNSVLQQSINLRTMFSPLNFNKRNLVLCSFR